jgi:hypothetical protein
MIKHDTIHNTCDCPTIHEEVVESVKKTMPSADKRLNLSEFSRY